MQPVLPVTTLRALIALVLAMPLAAQTVASQAGPAPPASNECLIGSYALADGTDVDVGPADEGNLRWRRKDGTTGELHTAGKLWTSTLGWTGRSDGKRVSFSACAAGRILFDGISGSKLQFDQTDTRFEGAGVQLTGRLTLPKGRSPVPIVVLVHGSERSSALRSYALQRQFASEGIGVFAYDKRGTGSSQGRYTQDYLLLANDAIAALREARRLAGPRAGPMGYQGGSQGGWVAPLAARIEPVDFVIVSFGLAVSPLQEDREAIAFDMQRQGYGAEIQKKADEIADASETILLSNFTEGYDLLAEVKRKYSGEDWFKHVRGNVTHYFLATDPEQIRREGPGLLPGIALQYDPMPVLRNLRTPQLWVLGGQDRDAPSGETVKRLSKLKADGLDLTAAVFPMADHGIYEYQTSEEGERMYTRNSDVSFSLMRDFILDRKVEGAYGNSRFIQ